MRIETLSPELRKKFEKIAKRTLHLNTLATRNSDSLDFSEQAVWSLVEAMFQAYEAGVEDGVISGLDGVTPKNPSQS